MRRGGMDSAYQCRLNLFFFTNFCYDFVKTKEGTNMPRIKISHFLKTIILVLSLIGFSQAGISDVNAAPLISSISGNAEQEQVVVIYGSGFGTKTPAAPMRWEDFESRTAGTKLNTFGWNHMADTLEPEVSTALPYSGTRSGHCFINYSDDDRCYAYYDFESPQTAIYASYMFRYDFSSGAAVSPNIKFDRTVSGGYGDSPNRGSTKDNVTNNPYYYQNTGNGIGYSMPDEDGDYKSHAGNSPGAYHRLESYLQLSSVPNADDGVWYESVDLDEWRNSVEMTMSSSAAGSTLNRFLLPFYFAMTAGSVTVYYDDVYIDNTRARVEIGDQPVWGDCASREIQIPSTWSQTSITVTVNQGRFQDGECAYLFVVDADGSSNSTGYPIMIGGGDASVCGSGSVPSLDPPTGLRILEE
jgi:hypothetical protein